MIGFYITLALLFFSGIVISFVLKLNLLDWNNLREEKKLKLEHSQAQFGSFLLFSLLLTANLYFLKQNYKLLILDLIIFLFIITIFIFAPENLSIRFLGSLKFFFLFLGKFFPQIKEKKPENPEDVSEKEIKTYIDVGKEEGILEEKEGLLLENILDFSETLVKEIMTPRTDMVVVSVDSDYGKVKETFMESNFSRLPVIENSLDNIVGILFLKDFFKVNNPEDFNIKEYCRKPYFVPEGKKVENLLKEMQENRISIAIVLDEYGGTQGLVTMEDLLEEIVGELEDEHAVPPILKVSKEFLSLSGKTHIEEVEALTGVEIEKGEYDTLAGFIMHLFGRIPKEGEEISYKTLNFKVETSDNRRIYRVIVKKANEQQK